MTETLPLVPLSPIAPEVAQKLSLNNIIIIAIASLFALLFLASIVAGLIIYKSYIKRLEVEKEKMSKLEIKKQELQNQHHEMLVEVQNKANQIKQNEVEIKHKELNQRLKQIEQELSLAEAQQKTAESQEKTARLQVELQAAQLEIEKYKVYGDPRKILAMECINFIKDNLSSNAVNSNGLRIGRVGDNVPITLSVVENNISNNQYREKLKKERKVLDLPHQVSYSYYLQKLLDQDLRNNAENSVIGVTGPNQIGKTSSAEAFMSLLSGKKIKLTIKACDFSTKENFDSLMNFLTYLRTELNTEYKGQKVNFALFVDELDNKAYDGKDNKEKYHITLLRMQSLIDDFFKSDITSDVQDPKHTYYLFFAGNNSKRFKKEMRPYDSYDLNWTSQLNTILHRAKMFHFDPITQHDGLEIGNYLGKTKFLDDVDDNQEKKRCVQEIRQYVEDKVENCANSVNKKFLQDLFYKHSQGTLTDFEGANKYFLELMSDKNLSYLRYDRSQKLKEKVNKFRSLKDTIDSLCYPNGLYARLGRDWKVCDYLDELLSIDDTKNVRKMTIGKAVFNKLLEVGRHNKDDETEKTIECVKYYRRCSLKELSTKGDDFNRIVNENALSNDVLYKIGPVNTLQDLEKNELDCYNQTTESITTKVKELLNEELEKTEEEIIQILQHDIKMNYNDFTLRELDHEFNKIKTQQPSSELGGHISVSSIKDQLNP